MRSMKATPITVVSGFALFAPACAGIFLNISATQLAPLPFLIAVPAFFLVPFIAVAIPVVLFYLWTPLLFNGRPEIPQRSVILLGIIATLEAAWFVMGWERRARISGQAASSLFSSGERILVSTPPIDPRLCLEEGAYFRFHSHFSLGTFRWPELVCIPLAWRNALTQQVVYHYFAVYHP